MVKQGYCTEWIALGGRFVSTRHCLNSAVNGTGKCTIHQPAYKAAQRAKKEACWDAEWKQRRRLWSRLPRAIAILKRARSVVTEPKLLRDIERFLKEVK